MGTSRTIDGRTRVTGIIGWPVEHSLSPDMHNRAYEALGLNWRYLPFPVPPGQVAEAVAGVRALGLAGVNVTIPHKEKVMPHLDSLTSAAQAIGAVNTIIHDVGGDNGDGRKDFLVGDNTDVLGFLSALEEAGVLERGGAGAPGLEALVLGAGGAARAAVYGLLSRGVPVRILARTPARADRLAVDMRRALSGARVEVVSHPPSRTGLLVNCTPVGMWPHEGASPLPAGLSLEPGMAVMDMVYRPLETALLRQTRLAGATPVSGLEMLVYQGVAAFELWTGRRPPVDVMREACLAAQPKDLADV